jgi:hypothetical protein
MHNARRFRLLPRLPVRALQFRRRPGRAGRPDVHQNVGFSMTVKLKGAEMSSSLVHLAGKPNTDVKSAPYHLSKSNQQR